MKPFFLFLFCLSLAFANTKSASKIQKSTNQTLTLNYLKQQPSGISCDFYIWLFLQQDISPQDAKEAYALAMYKNPKLFSLYFQKGGNQALSRSDDLSAYAFRKTFKRIC